MWIRNGSPSTTPNKWLLIRNSLLRAGSVEFTKKKPEALSRYALTRDFITCYHFKPFLPGMHHVCLV